jgi:hypothetical protein
MPSRLAAAALYAEVLALFGVRLEDPCDPEPFTFHADEVEIRVAYEEQRRLIWLTTVLEPIDVEHAPSLLPALLRWNFGNVREGMACSMDCDSAVPIVQSWIARPDAHLGEFEDVAGRHVTAVREIREIACGRDPVSMDDSAVPLLPLHAIRG